MARHLESARMRRPDRGTQLRAGDVRVGLERREPEVGPVVDETRGVLRTVEAVQLNQIGARPLEIGTGEVHLRSRYATGVDVTLELEVRIRRHAAGGPN